MISTLMLGIIICVEDLIVVYVGNIEICINKVRRIILVKHRLVFLVTDLNGARGEFSDVAFVVIRECSLLSSMEIVLLAELRVEILDRHLFPNGFIISTY